MPGPPKKRPLAGRILGMLFGTVFLAVGLLVLGLAASTAWDSVCLRMTPAIPCRVVSTDIVASASTAGGFDLEVTFLPAGAAQAGTQVHRVHRGDYAELRDIERHLPREAVAAGRRLSPADPIQLSIDAPGLELLLVTPFLGIPALFIWAACRIIRESLFGDGTVSPARHRPRHGHAPAVGFIVGLVFLFIGVIATGPAFVHPVWKMARARSWRATPCVVELSRVARFSAGRGGSTYSPEVLYRYEAGGETRRASRLEFLPRSGSRASAEQLAGEHPAGSNSTCFVDPDNPDEAILDRRPSWRILFAGLLLLFPVSGVLLLRWSWREWRARRVVGWGRPGGLELGPPVTRF